MRILIVLLRLEGGVGRSNAEIAKVLRRRGHIVDILSREDDLKKYSLFKSIIPLRRKIRNLMKKNNYDIIYTQDYSMALPLLFPYPLFWKKHIQFACGEKTYGLHKLAQIIVSKIMGKKLGVVCPELKEKFPKSTIIYRGTNLKEFKPLNKKREFICWADRSLENFSEEELKRVSDAVGMRYKVAKNIPREKMNEFYNQCKVFISLPYRGGYNNVWAESMAAGVPIVIGNKKGSGKTLPINKVPKEEKRKRGKRRKEEIEKLDHVGKIIEIIKNPKKINYRKWLIDNRFSWDEKAKEVEDFLKSYINKGEKEK